MCQGGIFSIRGAGTETLRYLTPGKPSVFPILPPRGNRCFPDPLPVRFSIPAKQSYKKLQEYSWSFLYDVRVRRIELRSKDWKSLILPLNYTRFFF